ncbi:MAG: ABC transporter substrate-binding protein, partial [Chlamydiota bacterium]
MKTSIILILSLFLISFSQQAIPQKKVLNLSFGNQVRTLDPRLGGENPTTHLIRMLFDGLIRRDEEGNAALAIAETYTFSEDFKTCTFYLKKTFWSDGTPLTADDFEYAWRKCLDPKTISDGAQNFYFIKNAERAVQRECPVSEVGIKALDPYTFQVELEFPVPYLIDILDSTFFYPIPKHLDQKDPGWIYQVGRPFVSNGPFKLKEWKQAESVTVEKNPSYWDRKHV